jgi:hypothetical protein
MSVIDNLLNQLTDRQKKIFVVALREVIKDPPGVGGCGQYLGNIAPLIFATDDEKLKALKLLNEWEATQ